MRTAGTDRRDSYSRFSSVLGGLDDTELRSILDTSSEPRNGWGMSQRGLIDGKPVFVKVVPVTDRERAHPHSTRNRFRLPTYYNYGVGSAGFGVFRELAAHEKTTRWVLDGAIESFPLLYHARMMPRLNPVADPRIELDDYVRRWNSSKALARYMRARVSAKSELWLVLEYFPHTAGPWLRANQRAVNSVIEQLCRTIAYLRSHGMVHFDAHLQNVVSDGQQLFLTDFGLVLDKAFDLRGAERAFLARHAYYDYGEAIASTGLLVLGAFGELEPEEKERVIRKYSIDSVPRHEALRILLTHLEDVYCDGDLPLEGAYVEAIIRYRPVILFMHTFLTTLQRDPRKRTPYDDQELRQLLQAAGAPLAEA